MSQKKRKSLRKTSRITPKNKQGNSKRNQSKSNTNSKDESSHLSKKFETQTQIAQEFFAPHDHGFGTWVKRYSPVLVTMLLALVTYFYLVFYLFYPTTLISGHYLQILLLIVFVFLIAGLLVYLGLRAELLFIRILSFIFIFVLFTFLLLFILIANSLKPAVP